MNDNKRKPAAMPADAIIVVIALGVTAWAAVIAVILEVYG